MVKSFKTKIDQKYVPQKGDAVWINFNPTTGHEQSGKRPALVISPAIYNAKSDLAIVCPITSKNKGYPSEILFNEKISGFILSDQIRTVDWKKRKAIYITKADEETVKMVVSKIKLLID